MSLFSPFFSFLSQNRRRAYRSPFVFNPSYIRAIYHRRTVIDINSNGDEDDKIQYSFCKNNDEALRVNEHRNLQWIFYQFNCKRCCTNFLAAVTSRQLYYGELTPGTYEGIARDLLTFVANFWPGTRALDRFCTSEAKYTGKDPRNL